MFRLALIRISSTCGAKRSMTRRTIGFPCSRTSPLSMLPMRRPCPPARTSPVMRITESCSGIAEEPLGTGEQQIVLAGGAPDHGHADLLRDLVTHLCQPRARDEKWNLHLRCLDHHLRGEPSRGVEDLVAALAAIEP